METMALPHEKGVEAPEDERGAGQSCDGDGQVACNLLDADRTPPAKVHAQLGMATCSPFADRGSYLCSAWLFVGRVLLRLCVAIWVRFGHVFFRATPPPEKKEAFLLLRIRNPQNTASI